MGWINARCGRSLVPKGDASQRTKLLNAAKPPCDRRMQLGNRLQPELEMNPIPD